MQHPFNSNNLSFLLYLFLNYFAVLLPFIQKHGVEQYSKGQTSCSRFASV